MIELNVGKNYDELDKSFDWEKSKNQIKQIFIHEGGSGSAKTWDILQFIITYCDNYFNWGKDILISRDTYSECKKTVLKDFIKILKINGIYDKKHHMESHPQSYKLYGNDIFFSGLDSAGAHGERHDLVFINEILETKWEDIRQLNQRCNEVFIGDYNPAYTEHWVFDKLIPRPDCTYIHSTQLHNPFLPQGQRDEILAYEVTQQNVTNGTADEYMWKVYGLGIRAAMKGVIFKYVTYIDKFPELAFTYGLDFGFTSDPSALVKYAEDKNNIWLELELYEPTETPQDINSYAIARGINMGVPVTADSSDKYTGENKGTVEMVKGLRGLGWNIHKVSKTQSVMFWLLSMKKKKIHIVKNDFYIHAKREQENYHLKEINGTAINQPIDKWNHFWDASRYAHMAYNKPKSKIY